MSIKFIALPDQDRLHESFNYDDASGELVWRHLRREQYKSQKGYDMACKRLVGNAASVACGNYRAVVIKSKMYFAHRLIWAWHNGPIPEGLLVDHKDGNGHNNRIENLRLSNHKLNGLNQKLASNNRSGVTGASWDPRAKTWVARARVNGKEYKVGYFKDIDDAAVALEDFRARKGFSEFHGNR